MTESKPRQDHGTLTVLVGRDRVSRIKEVSRVSGVNMSELVRGMIDDYLDTCVTDILQKRLNRSASLMATDEAKRSSKGADDESSTSPAAARQVTDS